MAVIASNANLINLIRNGGFELTDPDESIPPDWILEGALPPPTDGNRFKLVTEIPTTPAEPVHKAVVELHGTDPAEFRQEIDGFDLPLDIIPPVAPATEKLFGEGYQAREQMLIGQTEVTFSMAVSVPQGRVKLSLLARAKQTAATNLDGVTPVKEVTLSGSRWERIAFTVDLMGAILGSIGFRVEKLTSKAEIRFGGISLAVGEYEVLPYLGNPLLVSYPNGAIVMSMGDVCPPGFKEIEEDEGRFIRAANGGEAGLTGGDNRHDHNIGLSISPEELPLLVGPIEPVTLDEVISVPDFPDFLIPAFEPFEVSDPDFIMTATTGLPIRTYLGYTEGAGSKRDIALPRIGYWQVLLGSDVIVDGTTATTGLSHTHNINSEENIPPHRHVTLCKRLDTRSVQ